jgi:hypothetical protein
VTGVQTCALPISEKQAEEHNETANFAEGESVEQKGEESDLDLMGDLEDLYIEIDDF